MRIETFVAEALGDASHMVFAGGEAAVIDPQRDVRPYLAAADRIGATIRFVFETHVHNDYVSGGRELAEVGATIVAPASAGLTFPHMGIEEGASITLADAAITAVAAPGHTYEHTAYTAREAGSETPRAAFTGGAVLMGSAGRTDLLGPDHTEELTRKQWETAHRLAGLLAPESGIYPTHGSGSFCSTTGSAGERFGVLSQERERNPLFTLGSYEAFRAVQLQPAVIPSYYRHMAPINRAGPRVYGTPPVPPPIDLPPLEDLRRSGVHLVDIRSRAEYAEGHVSGSQLIEQDNSMVAYFGWLLPFDAPVLLVTRDAHQAAVATVDLFRIGFEHVQGYVPFGEIPASRVEQSPVASIDEVVSALRSGLRPVLDVRFGYESEASPLPGAVPLPITDLPERVSEAPQEPMYVVCESGLRAAMAASFLRASGRDATPMIEGGASTLQPLVA